jgi:hypothetical protein
MAVHRDISLASRADDRGDELDLGRVGDVIKIDAIIVSDEESGAVEGEIGVGAAVVGAGTGLGATRRRGSGRAGSASKAAIEARSGAKPAGFGKEASRCMPKDASPASYSPAFNPTRGSSAPARGLEYTDGLFCAAQSRGRLAASATTIVAARRENLDVISAIIVSPLTCAS